RAPRCARLTNPVSLEPDCRAGEPLVMEVDRFEHVPAGEGRVLLRVDGRYLARPGKRLLDAALFVDDGLAIHRHAPLPDPERDGDDWLWRAAFDVPASYVTDARTSFALEADPGRLYDLPRPSELLISSPAIPLSGRVAHTARRYAAAVAVLLTVAVAPGVLPSTAHVQVLKVRQPDGSIVYMTSDGQRLASIPPDAVVVDETAQPQAPSTTQPSTTQPPTTEQPQQGQQQAP